MPNYNSEKGSRVNQPDIEKNKTGKTEQGQSKSGLGQNQQSEKNKDNRGMGQSRK